MLLDRLAGEVDPDRAVEIIASGAEPLRDLIGALHSKLLPPSSAACASGASLRADTCRRRRVAQLCRSGSSSRD